MNMKASEYFRYHRNLMTYGVITFPDRMTLINFVSDMIAKEFVVYATTEETIATDLAEKRKWKNRIESDPILIDLYVKAYLVEQVINSKSLIYKMLKLIKKHAGRFVVTFDAEDSSELYDYVLGKLCQGDIADEVFSTGVQYTIDGDVTLRRNLI